MGLELAGYVLVCGVMMKAFAVLYFVAISACVMEEADPPLEGADSFYAQQEVGTVGGSCTVANSYNGEPCTLTSTGYAEGTACFLGTSSVVAEAQSNCEKSLYLFPIEGFEELCKDHKGTLNLGDAITFSCQTFNSGLRCSASCSCSITAICRGVPKLPTATSSGAS